MIKNKIANIEILPPQINDSLPIIVNNNPRAVDSRLNFFIKTFDYEKFSYCLTQFTCFVTIIIFSIFGPLTFAEIYNGFHVTIIAGVICAFILGTDIVISLMFCCCEDHG